MLSLVLAAALEFTAQDAHFAYERARELVENCTPRDAGTIRGRIAANRICDAVSAVGANVRRETFRAKTRTGEKEFANLYAEFGTNCASNRWVVLVSHYDTKPGANCPGANDGASTSGLLIAFASVLSARKDLGGNVLLVWTDGEECVSAYGPNDGFWGSKHAADWLASTGRDVRAVVCVDMIGDRDLSISIPANGSPKLVEAALEAAKRAGCPGLVKPIPEFVKDDHVAFLNKGFKAIDLIDFDYGPNNSYWHTPQDTMDKISEGSLLSTGRILAELLGILLQESPLLTANIGEPPDFIGVCRGKTNDHGFRQEFSVVKRKLPPDLL